MENLIQLPEEVNQVIAQLKMSLIKELKSAKVYDSLMQEDKVALDLCSTDDDYIALLNDKRIATCNAFTAKIYRAYDIYHVFNEGLMPTMFGWQWLLKEGLVQGDCKATFEKIRKVLSTAYEAEGYFEDAEFIRQYFHS